MSALSRRSFIKGAGAGMAAGMIAGARPAGAAPSERVRHAVIGLGSQGRSHARTFASFADCDVVALADVDPERRSKARGELPHPAQVRVEEDFRRLLEDPTIDSVSIATPDHWHTPAALAALHAGKHVYVEKPCCHNVREGFVLEEAAAATGLCVQHGTQARSSEGIMAGVQFIREGGLGKVRLAKAINHQLRGPIGRAKEEKPPLGVNYDLWLGCAPKVPFTRNRWHYNWHWFWDYGGGDLVNDGIHQVDMARWGLGQGMPQAVSASGGQLFYDDDHETPDTQVVTFEYGDCYLMYEMRLWTDYKLEGHDNGVVFYGDKGTLEFGRGGTFVALKGEARRQIGEPVSFEPNLRNFIDCVKAGAPDKLNAPAHEAAVSSGLCHLGNIATRVGRRLRWDNVAKLCADDAEANALLTRTYRAGYGLPEAG